LLDGLDVAVFGCDPAGVVGVANAAARAWLPGLEIGAHAGAVAVPELAAALASGRDAFECARDGQVLAGTRTHSDDGWTVWLVRDVTRERADSATLDAERARNRFLVRAGRRLGGSLNPARTERSIVDTAVELGDAATLVLPHGRGGYRWRHVARESGECHGQCVRSAVPPGVLEATEGASIGPDDHPADQIAGAWLDGAGLGEYAEATVVPLPGDRLPATTLVIWRRADTHGFDDPQRSTLTEFAARADVALAAAGLYAQQAHVATVLKSSLVPEALPSVPGVELGAEYRPAHEAVLIGGDFYSVHPDDEGTLFAFGDVMGKGVEAAATTGTVRQTLNALRRVGSDHETMLRVLNTVLLESGAADDRFVTLVLGTVRRLARGVRLRMSGGGHLPPLVIRADGEVEPVEIGGMVVGALREARFGTVSVDLAPGEVCVLYTDGITEAPGGALGTELYGEERLRETLRGSQAMPAAAVAERLALQADLWSDHTKHDDLTVLVIRAVS
jgi:serine phosphatase RsbU (regulator of sigma subunit)